MRPASTIILALDGRNFVQWKTLIPGILDSSPFAWLVTSGKLNPPKEAEAKTPAGILQMKNFTIGNRAAKHILMGSIDPDLAVTLFLETAQDIEAQEIWRKINKTTNSNTTMAPRKA